MNKKQFFKKVTNDRGDFLAEFIAVLRRKNIPFCVIGGLAVNAYVEPIVSLDLDIVVLIEKIDELLTSLKKKYKVKKYANSINITSSGSDLRIQIQTDERYQSFIEHSILKNVLGYELQVASREDVLQGKIWAAQDEKRRPSKRQKDIADIMRLVESHKKLKSMIPDSLRKIIFNEE
ncbi:MAG: hypothetical protein A2Y62_09145 [Candidatus Fischerbacteria bacterium RBG_13_37_8]|uniref:Uncharacterized protein n=1 Tax=Candidatus Fischerbacteria bacterium RBG_13_37_8 TaxID=1817863 RepID=A0A1F5VVR8_9BACT|nr:MAG: hypothetical protein A2Y62_09145 [Candidatus Fischerbacteria bacterium RBG_13_37_8]